ncbi:hypothetical protein [Rheinheimera sp. 4Y26]|uniref:hypothetical protein n=1 Tax=Rheinheimera sp. 4Y26 TaxID=2977811 RepID=UPI0021B0EF72|nr:hypothetical protein [Rheinheimera sp. 4Y26]MCT6698722.1 hypothetical protein [Rheinheimera sp. 4Y26]
MDLSTAAVSSTQLRYSTTQQQELRFPAKDKAESPTELGKKTVANFNIDNSAQLLSQVGTAKTTEQADVEKNDSVKVSSTIGRAASSGQLSREEAVAIYQKIATLL